MLWSGVCQRPKRARKLIVTSKKFALLAHAVSRLSPIMVIYMVRRILRNKCVPFFPNAYRKRLAKIEARIPLIETTGSLGEGVTASADFYDCEYRDMAHAVPDGNVRLYDRTIEFAKPDAIDWTISIPDEGDHQMWRVKLAHMGFVCPMLLDGSSDQLAAVVALLNSARATADMTRPGAFSGFWFPYAVSHRILAIGSGWLVARKKYVTPPDVDAQIASFLRLNAAFLLDNIEYELCNNHVERNLAALCLYFSHVGTVPPDIARRLERDIAHLVAKTILPDGTQIERSPMYQGLSMLAMRVMADAVFLSAELRQRLQKAVQDTQTAFTVLCHPDGAVALFNDAWHGEVPQSTLPPPPDGRTILSHGGYARLSFGQDMCLMDAGELGPHWNPGHGHADFLSVEVTLDNHRLIVDPGTSRYNSGLQRQRERSAAAHNGPHWQGVEPVAFLGCFKVGRLTSARLLAAQDIADDTIAGTLDMTAGRVLRMVRQISGQGYLVADGWLGYGTARVNWLIPEIWQIAPRDDGVALAIAGTSTRAVVTALSPIKTIAVTPSHAAHRYGQIEKANSLSVEPTQSDGRPVLLTWIGHLTPTAEARDQGKRLTDSLAAFLATN